MELEVSHLQSIGTGKSTSSRVITTEQGSKLRNRGDNYETPAEHRHREEHLVEGDNYGTGVKTTEQG